MIGHPFARSNALKVRMTRTILANARLILPDAVLHGALEMQDGSIAELHQARSDLRAALRANSGASADEQRRIADILQRAAAEIRKR